MRRGTRTLIAFPAVLALCLFSFVSGVHSVHHLSDSQGGADCPALSASNLVAVDVERSDLSPCTLVFLAVVAVGSEGVAPLQCFRRDQGRAPPAFPSA